MPKALLMPAAFVSHGSPMVALECGPYQLALERFGSQLHPAAIAVVSAHWTSGSDIRFTAADKNHLIYDFGGFPKPLHELRYEAPGNPALALRMQSLLAESPFPARLDDARGLDHGVWIPLRLMVPQADVPVVELSLPAAADPHSLFALGQALEPLRGEGVLILASGGVVHNLARLDWHHRDRPAEPWAQAFDAWFAERLESRDWDALFRYRELAPHAALAVPTSEHFNPVFIALGAASDTARIANIHQGFEYGSLSMRSFALS